MKWPLGEYISTTLQKRGGRRAGWTQARLSELSGLSTTEISWIVTGEASGKKSTPDLRLETLIALAKALSVKEQTLIDAYKGKTPDEQPDNTSQQVVQEIINLLLKNVSPKLFVEALLTIDGPEKFQEYLAEAKKLNAEKKKREESGS